MRHQHIIWLGSLAVLLVAGAGCGPKVNQPATQPPVTAAPLTQETPEPVEANQTKTSVTVSVPTATNKTEAGISETTQGAKTEPATNEAPVQFTYGDLTENKRGFTYKVKITSAKTVKQVDIAYKCYDSAGQQTDDLTAAWQNIVKSVQQPIASGQTYSAKAPLTTEAAKCEAKIARVFFADDTNWTP